MNGNVIALIINATGFETELMQPQGVIIYVAIYDS